jgi:glycosyltransferase involved in cell wall biosynthesis
MKLAIIGNPINNISSKKFLDKFLNLVGNISQKVYVISDLTGNLSHDNIIYLETTHSAKLLGNLMGNYGSIPIFILSQLGLAYGLARCISQIDKVIIFPITMFLPVILAKLFDKEVILYEAQDVFSMLSDQSCIMRIKSRFILLIRKFALDQVDTIIVEGKSIIRQNNLESYIDKIIIIPQFVDTKRYYIIKDYENRDPIIGFISTLEERKGALEFAQAAKLVCESVRDLRFCIVGSGPLKQAIISETKDLISNKRMNLIDNVHEDIMPSLLNEFILFVLPSKSEGLPNTILESMACGTPVLSTSVGAIPDIVKDGLTGFIIEALTPESIAEGILRSIRCKTIFDIINNADMVIKNEFDYEKALIRYELYLCH